MEIKSELRINGNIIDRSILQKDAVAGARYAARKWLQNLMLDVVNDNIEAIIMVDGKEIANLELKAKQKADKLIMSKSATISKYYTWVTLTQGHGRTYGVSYGLNDLSKKPGKEKPVEEIQQKLF